MSDKSLIWKNLLIYCCPRCDEQLWHDKAADAHRCTGSHCLFFVYDGRFKNLVGGMKKPKLQGVHEDELKTLHDLNNL